METLSTDIVASDVMERMEVEDVVALGRTCRFYFGLLCEESVWRALLRRDFQADEENPTSYRRRYSERYASRGSDMVWIARWAARRHNETLEHTAAAMREARVTDSLFLPAIVRIGMDRHGWKTVAMFDYRRTLAHVFPEYRDAISAGTKDELTVSNEACIAFASGKRVCAHPITSSSSTLRGIFADAILIPERAIDDKILTSLIEPALEFGPCVVFAYQFSPARLSRIDSVGALVRRAALLYI